MLEADSDQDGDLLPSVNISLHVSGRSAVSPNLIRFHLQSHISPGSNLKGNRPREAGHPHTCGVSCSERHGNCETT